MLFTWLKTVPGPTGEPSISRITFRLVACGILGTENILKKQYINDDLEQSEPNSVMDDLLKINTGLSRYVLVHATGRNFEKRKQQMFRLHIMMSTYLLTSRQRKTDGIYKHYACRMKINIADIIEPHREKTGLLPMRKQRRRPASR